VVSMATGAGRAERRSGRYRACIGLAVVYTGAKHPYRTGPAVSVHSARPGRPSLFVSAAGQPVAQSGSGHNVAASGCVKQSGGKGLPSMARPVETTFPSLFPSAGPLATGLRGDHEHTARRPAATPRSVSRQDAYPSLPHLMDVSSRLARFVTCRQSPGAMMAT
jgi:hypothetical protein